MRLDIHVGAFVNQDLESLCVANEKCVIEERYFVLADFIKVIQEFDVRRMLDEVFETIRLFINQSIHCG